MSSFELQGKSALVTGGSGVLGGAMARGLAAAGVAILERRREPADRAVEAIRSQGGEALTLIADVTSPAQLREARERVLGAWGRLDILVNAAGDNLPDATVFGAQPLRPPERSLPLGVIAHSTHVRGAGRYRGGVERPCAQVTLATRLGPEICERLSLGYRDPASIDLEPGRGREPEGILLVPKAGEILYRVGRP